MKLLRTFVILWGALGAMAASAAITISYASQSTADFASYSFTLADNFTPASFTANSFTVAPPVVNSSTQYGPVTLNGMSYTFYTSGGFDEDGFDFYDGPVVFTGPTNSPTFLNGSFLMNDGSDDGTLTISGSPEAPAAVPEPASWALMVGGFGLVGGALRRRRGVNATA